MTPDQYQRVKEVFLAVCERPDAEQDEAAARLCGADDELHGEVRSLLESHRNVRNVSHTQSLPAADELRGSRTEADPPEEIERRFAHESQSSAVSHIEAGRGASPHGAAHGSRGETGNFSHRGRFESGTVLAERYRIVSILGMGGMGEVYRADDITLEQPVALKFLPPSFAKNSTWLSRFHNEVRMSRQVTHPNVCRVFDIGEVDGEQFISMEFVDGEDLAALLRRIGRLPRDKAIQISRQLCAGLAAAHDRGVLHRDLKPANIMLDGRGQVRITDFGISAPVEGGHDAAAGTPAYMAPEQFSKGEATIRSDIYSLGLVLYEVFTGRQAFTAHSMLEYSRLHRTGKPTHPSTFIDDMDPLVERVILRCLEKDPNKRPATALAVSAALPGGDPLAAALAAGETPSPEMVAAAGDDSGISSLRAGVLLAVTLVGLVTSVLLAGKAFVLPRMSDPVKPPAVLADHAREILASSGYDDGVKMRSRAQGFGLDDLYVEWVHEAEHGKGRWDLLASARPGPFYFWYRESPQFMLAKEDIGMVTLDDPARSIPEMRTVVLDVSGRLMRLEILPDTHGIHPATTQPAAVDFSKLFQLANLKKSDFVPVSANATPPMFADARYAWDGAYPEKPGEKIRVEAASFEGRPVFFKIIESWRSQAEAMGLDPNPDVPLGRNIFLQATLILCATGSALLLAWRNSRAGRGDTAGAQRLSGLFLILGILIWLVYANHVPQFVLEMRLFFRVLGWILVPAGIVWMFYLALEPYVRKIWPQTVISWSRLLAGKVTDPLVAAHILTGLAVAVWATVLGELTNVLPMYFGRAAAVPNMTIMARFMARDNAAAVALQALHNALYMGLLYLLALVLFRLVLQRAFAALKIKFINEVWIASAAFVVLAAAINAQWFDASWLQWTQSAIVSCMILLLMVRFGLVATMAGLWGIFFIRFLPITPDMSVWYSGQTRYAIVLIAILAVAATALATKRVREVVKARTSG